MVDIEGCSAVGPARSAGPIELVAEDEGTYDKAKTQLRFQEDRLLGIPRPIEKWGSDLGHNIRNQKSYFARDFVGETFEEDFEHTKLKDVFRSLLPSLLMFFF